MGTSVRFLRVVLLTSLTSLATASCGAANVCEHQPIQIDQAKPVEAAADACQGRPELYVLKWYEQGSKRYPLRCGKPDPRGSGYRHILQELPSHSDPLTDSTFDAEIANTLASGQEGVVGGGNYRYTIKYTEGKSACFRGWWGFRVVLAKAPPLADGQPLGIVTAYYLTEQPKLYP